MEVVTTPERMRELARRVRAEGKTLGLVPTMGYLHAGHRSLMEASASENDATVVSIFVNPIQFGPNEDFARYPRNFEGDAALCAGAGAGIIYAPGVVDMYPAGFQTKVSVGSLTGSLCGASRPGHFDGVATVVTKLFNAVTPDRAYFGEKDFQQLAVIRRMVADLDMGVRIVGMPIVREPDGLAMSSRNVYLSPEERARALGLNRALKAAILLHEGGEKAAEPLLARVLEVLAEHSVVAEYAELRDATTLESVTVLSGPTLLALAARVGTTRLIDNVVLGKHA